MGHVQLAAVKCFRSFKYIAFHKENIRDERRNGRGGEKKKKKAKKVH